MNECDGAAVDGGGGVLSLGRLHQVGRYGHAPLRGGVAATVHVLVHLLGHLLGVAEVGGGHHHPEDASWRRSGDGHTLTPARTQQGSEHQLIHHNHSRLVLNNEKENRDTKLFPD